MYAPGPGKQQVHQEREALWLGQERLGAAGTAEVDAPERENVVHGGFSVQAANLGPGCQKSNYLQGFAAYCAASTRSFAGSVRRGWASVGSTPTI